MPLPSSCSLLTATRRKKDLNPGGVLFLPSAGEFGSRKICLRSAIFYVLFSLFLKDFFGFQGGWRFGFLAFVAFTWVFVAFVLFISHPLHSFRILCIASSADGFGFSHPLLSQLVFGLGFLHPQHRKFLSGAPPTTPLSTKMHASLNHHFFDHHATLCPMMLTD